MAVASMMTCKIGLRTSHENPLSCLLVWNVMCEFKLIQEKNDFILQICSLQRRLRGGGCVELLNLPEWEGVERQRKSVRKRKRKATRPRNNLTNQLLTRHLTRMLLTWHCNH